MAVLASRTWGEAGRPPALLVHGITSSSRSWWTVGPALAERGFAVLAVDLRGHGASPRGSAGLGPAELAADVVETVAAWQGAGRDGAGPPGGRGGPAVDLLVGHSLGALVALALLAGHPGFARRVVLEDPPGPSFVDWDELADGIENDVGRALREPEALRVELEAANPAWAPGEAAHRVADYAACDVATVAPAARAGLPLDLGAAHRAQRPPREPGRLARRARRVARRSRQEASSLKRAQPIAPTSRRLASSVAVNPQAPSASSVCSPGAGGGPGSAQGVRLKRGAGAGRGPPAVSTNVPRHRLWGWAGGVAGQAQRPEQLPVEPGLEGADRDVAAVAGLEDAVEGGAAVEQVRASLPAPEPQRAELVDHGGEQGGAVEHGRVHHLASP